MSSRRSGKRRKKSTSVSELTSEEVDVPAEFVAFMRRPKMFLADVHLDSVLAFVSGFDLATSGGLLVGFREWLVSTVGDGNNLAVPGLVRLLARKSNVRADQEVAFFLEQLESFFAQRAKANGLRSIFARYEDWLRGHDWYHASSPHWIERDTSS